MEEKKIKLTIKQTSSTFEVEVDAKATVRGLKEACAEKSGISADDQRLIFKGNSLKYPISYLITFFL
jgi:hypothetical protein